MQKTKEQIYSYIDILKIFLQKKENRKSFFNDKMIFLSYEELSSLPLEMRMIYIVYAIKNQEIWKNKEELENKEIINPKHVMELLSQIDNKLKPEVKLVIDNNKYIISQSRLLSIIKIILSKEKFTEYIEQNIRRDDVDKIFNEFELDYLDGVNINGMEHKFDIFEMLSEKQDKGEDLFEKNENVLKKISQLIKTKLIGEAEFDKKYFGKFLIFALEKNDSIDDIKDLFREMDISIFFSLYFVNKNKKIRENLINVSNKESLIFSEKMYAKILICDNMFDYFLKNNKKEIRDAFFQLTLKNYFIIDFPYKYLIDKNIEDRKYYIKRLKDVYFKNNNLKETDYKTFFENILSEKTRFILMTEVFKDIEFSFSGANQKQIIDIIMENLDNNLEIKENGIKQLKLVCSV